MRTSEETKDITLLGQKNVKYEFKLSSRCIRNI